MIGGRLVRGRVIGGGGVIGVFTQDNTHEGSSDDGGEHVGVDVADVYTNTERRLVLFFTGEQLTADLTF